ncbi:DUF723 domain-containing protein [Neisseria sp. N95_16]|uniref:DUF723 domain-containing protein n=1 Tax=Neisseria brasiliensis TaxID=2666100 RepID=A0A7X2GZA2_9NEIS|nr:DUF723 domain-containing protein [Neisseria brasiliensis]PJO10765.1 DUF723 domain-containing protein [Neisseria sp. N95_16]
MPKPLKLSEAVERLRLKFPDIELVTYSGASKPCVIRCKTHGIQTVSSYSEIMRSVAGCPECGTLHRHKQAGYRFKQRAVEYEMLKKRVVQLEAALVKHGIELPRVDKD